MRKSGQKTSISELEEEIADLKRRMELRHRQMEELLCDNARLARERDAALERVETLEGVLRMDRAG